MELENLVIKLSADASGLTNTIKQIQQQIDKTTKETKKQIDPSNIYNASQINKLGNIIKNAFAELNKTIKPQIDTSGVKQSVQEIVDESKKIEEEYQALAEQWSTILSGDDDSQKISVLLNIVDAFDQLEKKIKDGTASLAEYIFYVKVLNKEIEGLEDINLNPDTENLSDEAKQYYEDLKNKLNEYAEKLREVQAEETQASSPSKWESLINVLKKIGSVAGKIGKQISKPLKKVWEGFKGKLKQVGSMLSQAFVFGVLSKVIQSISKAFTTVIKGSDELQASLSRLKGSFLTAMQPIIDTVIPILKKLIDTLAELFNQLAKVTTQLTGKTIKATKEEAKATAELLEANNSTQSFDELHTVGGSNDNSIQASFEGVDEEEDKQVTFFNFLDGILIGTLDIVDKILGKIKDVSGALQDLGTTLGKVANKTTDILSTLANDVLTFDFGFNAGEMISNFFAETDATEIGNTIFDILESAVDVTAGLISGIQISDVFEFIFDLILGLVEGFMTGDLVNSIIHLLGTVISKVLTIGPEITVALLTSLANFVVDGFSAFADAVEEKGFFGAILELFYNLAIKPIVELFKGLWDGLPDSWKEGIMKLINGVKEMFTNFGEWWKNLWNGLGEFFSNIWNGIKNFFSKIVTGLKKDFQNIGDFFSTVFNGIKNVANTVATAIGSFFTNLGTKLKNTFQNIGNGIANIWNSLTQKLKEKWTNFTDTITKVWTAFKNFFSNIIDGIKSGWTKFTDGLKSMWEKMCNGIKDFFRGMVNGVLGFVNGIIGGIETAINFLIRCINKLSWDVPDWVPLIGGKKFGFNISEVSMKKIPLLAQGGIVTQATPLIAGEAGAEAILPLENNTEWMYKLADIIASKNEQKVVLSVDGKEFGQVAVKSINNITKQSGRLPLVMA